MSASINKPKHQLNNKIYQLSSHKIDLDFHQKNLNPNKDLYYKISMEKQNVEPKESRYRHIILIFYLIAALANSLPVHTFSSINSIVEKTFHIDPILVTLNALLFTLSHTMFAYPCNWLINRHGMRISFLFGSGLLILGVWLRTFLNDSNPFLCLLGSLLAAAGGIFILNTPAKVSFNWFKTETVPLITFATVLANLLSSTIGAIIPSLFVSNASSQEHIINFLRIQAVVITIPLLIFNLIFRQRPKIPPSKAAELVLTKQKERYTVLMKKLFTNTTYLKIAASLACNFGVFIALISILDQCLQGLDYGDQSSHTTSLIIGSATVFGIIGNAVFSIAVKKTKAFKYACATAAFASFASYLIFAFVVIQEVKSLVTIGLTASLVGFFVFCYPSLAIVYASEVIFPIDQASSAGYLFAITQTFSFIIGFSFIKVLNKTAWRSSLVLGIIGLLLLISFLMILTTKEVLNKSQFEENKLKQSCLTASLVDQVSEDKQ